jgi:DNA polymerase/3'-5' exonuclease PolX
LTFDINDAKDVQNIEGIGQKLRDKIKELLETGKL